MFDDEGRNGLKNCIFNLYKIKRRLKIEEGTESGHKREGPPVNRQLGPFFSGDFWQFSLQLTALSESGRRRKEEGRSGKVRW